MIDFNIFSGKTYVTTGNVKQSLDGDMFTKVGDMWVSEDGNFIRESNGEQFNLQTGINSTFGDPFDDQR